MIWYPRDGQAQFCSLGQGSHRSIHKFQYKNSLTQSSQWRRRSGWSIFERISWNEEWTRSSNISGHEDKHIMQITRFGQLCHFLQISSIDCLYNPFSMLIRRHKSRWPAVFNNFVRENACDDTDDKSCFNCCCSIGRIRIIVFRGNCFDDDYW